MKFLHLTKRDTAKPGQKIYLNLYEVMWLAPLVSKDGTVIALTDGSSVTVTESFDDLTARIYNMGFGY